jgi:hypothetical protein
VLRSDSASRPSDTFEPSRPALVAFAVFVLAMLTLCWPMLGGKFLLGDDQYIAGYTFRHFGAEYFRTHGRIPQWNPYLFGGLPFIAAMHGDIFYPTAWLRWVLPVDTAMNIGLAVHFVIAGCTMYALLRALRVSWAGALVGGLAYQMTGIIASLVKPGHDGKLYVSALAPLALLALLRAIRDRRIWGYGLFALTIGLCMLTPHPQMTYYLLVYSGLWTLYLALLDPERPAGIRWPVVVAVAFGAVLLGLAVAAIQYLPFIKYIPFSPRGEGGGSGGWEYATQFSMPPLELVTTVLPQFNGVLQNYWGSNFFKLHTEYLGAVVIILAALGWGDRARRKLLWATGAIALLFLLVAFGGHTPFYLAWYKFMPYMDKVRAAGMAFYLVALSVAIWAALGTDRLLRGEVKPRALYWALGVLGGFALLGASGALEPIATALAPPEQLERAMANAGALQGGAIRLLVVVLAAGAVLLGIDRGKLRGAAALALLALVTAGDLWSIDRLFFDFKPPASVLFRDDALVQQLKQSKPPFRVLDAQGVYGQFGSILAEHDVQQVLGYHGNEIRFYDELLGGKNVWQNVVSPAVMDLVAMRYLVLRQEQAIPGFHKVLGPVEVAQGGPGVLFERDTAAPYVRVFGAAAKIPDAQVVPTLIDPRFPLEHIVLYSDTAGVTPEPIRPNQAFPPSPVRADVAEWAPGSMRITLTGADTRPNYLLVSENWYPDWHATVDGKPAALYRGNHTFLSVVLPPGAREVRLDFKSADYARGKLITMIALLATAALLASPWVRRRNVSA